MDGISMQAAQELESALRQELHDITQVLQDRFPFIPGKEFTPKRNNRTRGYVEDATFKLKDFNPLLTRPRSMDPNESRQFQSQTTTTSGKMKIDRNDFEEPWYWTSDAFFRILEITKSLGMISEGANAWLRHLRMLTVSIMDVLLVLQQDDVCIHIPA